MNTDTSWANSPIHQMIQDFESPTPETDAAEHDIDEIPAFPFVSSNFSRKLERERDTAIAELEAWRNEKGPEGWWVKYEDHMAQLNEMTLRWERTNDLLFEERALTDRLAKELEELLYYDLDVNLGRLKSSKDALAAWKEARSES